MDEEKFEKQKRSNAKKLKDIISATEIKTQKMVEDFTKEDFKEVFREGEITAFSFYNWKTIISRYVEKRCGEDSKAYRSLKSLTIDQYDSDELYVKYIKDFKQLQNYIDESLKIVEQKYGDGVIDTPITILYLAWCGLSYNETLNFKKADISPDENAIFVNGEKQFIGEEIIKFLRFYAKTDFYLKITPSGTERRFDYQATPYLLRTNRSSQLTYSALINSLTRMHSLTEAKVPYGYSDIFKSGVFNRVLTWAKNNDIDLMNCDVSSMSFSEVKSFEKIFCREFKAKQDFKKVLCEFRRWKKYFYE